MKATERGSCCCNEGVAACGSHWAQQNQTYSLLSSQYRASICFMCCNSHAGGTADMRYTSWWEKIQSTFHNTERTHLHFSCAVYVPTFTSYLKVPHCDEKRLNIFHIHDVFGLTVMCLWSFRGAGTVTVRSRTLSYQKRWERSSCQAVSR